MTACNSARLRPRRWLRSMLLLLGLLLTQTSPQAWAKSAQQTVDRTGAPPVAAREISDRLVLATKLRTIDDFFKRVRGPVTLVSDERHEDETILRELDHETREQPGVLARNLALFTTYFKHAAIMGWSDTQRQATVEGRVVVEPVVSADDMMTIDLEITRLVIDERDLTAQIDGQRFIRVEVFGAVRLALSTAPHQDQCVRISGPLRIDHDGDNFYEIHPTQADAITLLTCAAR